jgi:hypothetical protein
VLTEIKTDDIVGLQIECGNNILQYSIVEFREAYAGLNRVQAY